MPCVIACTAWLCPVGVMRFGHMGQCKSYKALLDNGNSTWHMMRAGHNRAGQGKAGQDRTRRQGHNQTGHIKAR